MAAKSRRDPSSAVVVQDLRPEAEKKSEIFSYLITSSGYGIYRKGDETLDPPMPQLFRRRAYEASRGTGANPTITIYHMVVYMNLKSQLRGQAIGAGVGGIIGTAIASGLNAGSTVNISQSIVDRAAFEAGGGDEYERAFYTDEENPNHASVFVIYIDAAINGKRVFVKTLAPTTAPKGEVAYSLAVQSAIQFFLSQYKKP